MTPTRRRALEWVRDDGNPMDLDDRWEPSKQILVALDRDELITWTTEFGRTWNLTKLGAEALER